MWWTLAKRFWPVLAAAALLFAAYLWHLSEVHTAVTQARAEAKAAYDAELERDRQHRREIDDEVQLAHQKSLEDVRAAVARELRGRPIRCMLDAASQVRTGRDSGESTGSATGESALRSAPDIRSSLVQRGETCERLRQQLIAIRQRQEAR